MTQGIFLNPKLWEIISKQGLSLVISIMLVLWVILRVDGLIAKTQQDIQTAKIEMSTFAQTTTDYHKSQTSILRTICINTAVAAKQPTAPCTQ